MTDFGLSRRAALLAPAGLAMAAVGAGSAARSPKASLAPTPPMGWNSWNSFATTITEAQALENAAIMAAKLKPHGYDVFTIDIQWYEPGATGYRYNDNPVPALDAYGRLVPAPNRFPSTANGAGFAPLAAKIHALGLKFGVHLMRGIPRLAVERNLPVLGGGGVRARDIADRSSVCPWNPDMFGVDMTRPGAQAYYDSVFALFARWGVDFVKMDDMSRPYDAHAPEIEAAHKAILACGRPIILSLSPGETPVVRGPHVRRHAQMWRISDDFWDEWPMLKAQFTRLENWSPYCGPGSWPDADMLPLGRLAMGERDTRFTRDEQRTLMTLWSIARSPLIMGGDLRHLDDWTLSLLTNREVIAVNQHSIGNRPWYFADHQCLWTARSPDRRTAYVAMFNLSDGPEAARMTVPLRRIGLDGGRLHDLWTGKELGAVTSHIETTVPPHGAALFSVR
ncbi:glycoside hydrolase family 27 protein [Sphingomonas sp. DT-204]|uniref:glycoside hydrolase family 27 protein n=1 Tax=Sphingomonas sp. DT-204 TaxID=3396166 RepID=UPI003F1D6BC1